MLVAAVVDSLSDHTYDGTTVSSSRVNSGHAAFSKQPYDTLSNMKEPTLINNNGKDSTTEKGANDNLDTISQLQAAEAKLKPIKEYATGITFAPKLDEGMYLVGAGVRKKSIIKVYALAMYASATVLTDVSSSTLGNTARSFNSLSPTTSFVLEMVYSVGAEKIAGAIGESVKPRYHGSPSDIGVLESLIIEGVNRIGGQAVKGTTFRFDCSTEGVAVTVDGTLLGTASFDGLGSAFVDVFMDDNAVSPTLVDSCLDTWSGDEAKLLAASLLEVSEGSRAENLSTTQDAELDEDEGEKVVEHELDVLYDTNPDVKRELVDQLPSALLDSPSNEAELSTCIGYACREYPRDIPISHIAKIRARDSFVRQQTAALDAAQLDDEIRARASDLAAQRLHILASQVDGDENETAPAGPVKNLLKHLFPVF